MLPTTETIRHRPERCVRCTTVLDPDRFIARTGLCVLDIETDHESGLAGLRVRHDKHLYGEIACRCGHLNRSQPGRCPDEPMWDVALSEWHLIGPMLASLIVCLSYRMHMSRQRTREFLRDWLGIELSTAALSQCLHEAGRAVEPLEQQLVDELHHATLVHVDETSWKENGRTLWLWVITTSTLCLFFIGHRTGEIIDNVFDKGFIGWLMSDGYVVYRHFNRRLRCWAHLKRKALGLLISLSPDRRRFGKAAREFLYDWQAIWAVLDHPWLPLTNNEAERALRHWVIARRISYGTRTKQGSRALALSASVIETCRQRHIPPWPYLARVIVERRQGRPAPPLPAAAAYHHA